MKLYGCERQRSLVPHLNRKRNQSIFVEGFCCVRWSGMKAYRTSRRYPPAANEVNQYRPRTTCSWVPCALVSGTANIPLSCDCSFVCGSPPCLGVDFGAFIFNVSIVFTGKQLSLPTWLRPDFSNNDAHPTKLHNRTICLIPQIKRSWKPKRNAHKNESRTTSLRFIGSYGLKAAWGLCRVFRQGSEAEQLHTYLPVVVISHHFW